MARYQDDRYQTVRELQRDLYDYIEFKDSGVA